MDECLYRGANCPFSNMTCKFCPFSNDFRNSFIEKNNFRLNHGTIESFEIFRGHLLVSSLSYLKSVGYYEIVDN